MNSRLMDSRLMVRSMTVEADGVLGLELVDPSGSPLPQWEPGAHLDVVLPSGMVRQYSLCGDPADRGSYQVGVLRERAGRGGSAYIHDVLRPGDLLAVRGPKNHFALVDAPEYLFVAGGIGVTPLLAMVDAAVARGVPYRFLYGGRAAASMAYVERLSALGSRLTVWPQDTHGLLDLPAAIGAPRDDLAVYCCGPEPLLSAVEAYMADWPPGALRIERFAAPRPVGAAANGNAGESGVTAAAAAGSSAGAAFDVVLARSGRCLPVAADRSLLDVLLDAGVEVLSDCREGICASCETTVVEGPVEHRDFILTAAERESGTVMMPCVSRGAGDRLVLDL